jgi:peptidoglycan-associated lipoprotein
MQKIALAVTVASALALSACAKKPPAELPPAPQDTSTPTPPPPQQAGPVPGSQEHFRQVMAGRDTIYFDTDMFRTRQRCASRRPT